MAVTWDSGSREGDEREEQHMSPHVSMGKGILPPSRYTSVVVALNEVHQTLSEPGHQCVRVHGIPCEPRHLNAGPKRQALRDRGSRYLGVQIK